MADDIDQIDDEADVPEEGEGDEGDSELDELLARLDARYSSQQDVAALNDSLRQSVSRLQSLMSRTPAEPDAKFLDTVAKQQDDVFELLGMLAGDESILDPAVKSRITNAVNERRQRRSADQTKNEILSAVREVMGQGQPRTPEDILGPDEMERVRREADALQKEVVRYMNRFDFDPNDLDWAAANAALAKDGPDGLRDFVADAIRSASAEDGKVQRRAGRQAKNPPTPKAGAAGARSDEEIVMDRNADPAEKRAALKRMGVGSA